MNFSIYFNGLLLQEAETRGLVDGEHIRSDTGKELVIARPLEDGQRLRLVGVEGAFLKTRKNIPDDNGLRLIRGSGIG